MHEGFAPRFAIEAGFLILLAVGLGLADVRPAFVVLVMVVGWLLVSLVEWLAWRSAPELERRYALGPRPAAAPEPEPPLEWDVEEILVPAPEPLDYPVRADLGLDVSGGDSEQLTSVLAPGGPEAGPEGEAEPGADAEPEPEPVVGGAPAAERQDEERPKRRLLRRRGSRAPATGEGGQEGAPREEEPTGSAE